MPPVFTSVEAVAQALIYHPHSSASRLTAIIAKDPERYGPKLHLDTVNEVLRRLKELNFVRVHYDEKGALYEFGNQPHPVLVCVRCERDRARQDVIFTSPAGPFTQLARSKDGRLKMEQISLLQLIEFYDFVPVTYRFEVLGFCRAHASDKALWYKSTDFMRFLLQPETGRPEFKTGLALDSDQLVRDHVAMAKQLTESPKIGAVASRIIDQPTQFLADRLDPMLERLKDDMTLLRCFVKASPDVEKQLVAALLDFLYARAIERKYDELGRLLPQAKPDDGVTGEIFRQAVEGADTTAPPSSPQAPPNSAPQ